MCVFFFTEVQLLLAEWHLFAILKRRLPLHRGRADAIGRVGTSVMADGEELKVGH